MKLTIIALTTLSLTSGFAMANQADDYSHLSHRDALIQANAEWHKGTISAQVFHDHMVAKFPDGSETTLSTENEHLLSIAPHAPPYIPTPSHAHPYIPTPLHAPSYIPTPFHALPTSSFLIFPCRPSPSLPSLHRPLLALCLRPCPPLSGQTLPSLPISMYLSFLLEVCLHTTCA